jgi:hypothetical protein
MTAPTGTTTPQLDRLVATARALITAGAYRSPTNAALHAVCEFCRVDRLWNVTWTQVRPLAAELATDPRVKEALGHLAQAVQTPATPANPLAQADATSQAMAELSRKVANATVRRIIEQLEK